jgi:hypothetical protein
MPTDQIVALLITERERLSRAIEALQGPKRRGRPPKNPLMTATTPAAPPRRRKGMSAANRKTQSLRMKKYWAAK